jgi:IclR family KDG regulon transcriptional repressor
VTPAKAPPNSPKYPVRAADRVLDILELFLGVSELNLTEVANRAHLTRSTAFKLLSVLEQRGYVCRERSGDKYRIDLQAFRVGRQYLVNQGGLTRVARPALEELARFAPGVTSKLSILTHGRVVLLDYIEIDPTGPDSRVIGLEQRAYCTALGKALLAGQPDDVLAALLDELELEWRTPSTVTDKQALRASLEQVRIQGYAVDDEESTLGLIAVAAPIYNERGRVIAAMSVSGIKAALLPDIPLMVERVRLAAQRTSERLGFVAEEPKQGEALGVHVHRLREALFSTSERP